MLVEQAAKEIIWISRLFKDIIEYYDTPVIYICLKQFYIREKVTEGHLLLCQVSSENRIANMMTTFAKASFTILM